VKYNQHLDILQKISKVVTLSTCTQVDKSWVHIDKVTTLEKVSFIDNVEGKSLWTII